MKPISFTILILLLFSCASEKLTPNYKVTNDGIVIWRYTKSDQPKKDILSTGDTLVTFKDQMYILPKTQ